MNFLLDINVISERVKPRPDPGVVAWLAEADEDRVFISVTLAELRQHRTPGRKRRLDAWLRRGLPLRFEGRVLPIDGSIADAWGWVVAHREAAGRPIGPMDAFIAATARVHQLALVTRNAADFKTSVRDVIDPWSRT